MIYVLAMNQRKLNLEYKIWGVSLFKTHFPGVMKSIMLSSNANVSPISCKQKPGEIMCNNL